MNEGARAHLVIKEDSLNLGAVQIETEEWVYPHIFLAKEDMPKVGEDVLVVKEDGRLYWVGVFKDDGRFL